MATRTELRQERLHAVGDLGTFAQATLHIEDDRPLLVRPARKLRVFDAIDGLCHVFQADRSAIGISDDEALESLGLEQLIIGGKR